MSGGWVKLYRKTQQSNMYKSLNSVQRDVMINCLMLANHKPNKWEWKGEIFEVQPGQFITSLPSLKNVCAKDVSKQNIRTALKKLIKWDFLEQETTKTGRLITIKNWEKYQKDEPKTNRQLTDNEACNSNDFKDKGTETNRQLTDNQQTANRQLTSNKNVKNVKNDKEREGDNLSSLDRKILKILKSIPKYPFDFDKDVEQLKEYKTEFPTVDILEEIKKWKTYKRDKPLKEKSNARLQFRNWLSNAEKWSDNSASKKKTKKITADEIRNF